MPHGEQHWLSLVWHKVIKVDHIQQNIKLPINNLQFYDISTIVGYLMLNPLYIYIYIYIYIYMICKHILLLTFLNEPPEFFFAHS